MCNALNEFAIAVKSKRDKLGLTQVELGTKAGMSHRTIMKIECNQSNPKFETIALLAQALDISLDAVIYPEAELPDHIPKVAYDYFKGMPEEKAQACIDILESFRALTGNSKRS